MKDIEIARNAKLLPITKIAEKLGIDEEYLEQYGKYKAKISNEFSNVIHNRKNGKLILVTAINPTPLGEGKTTMSIGLADGLSKIGKKSILALREPSLRTCLWSKRRRNRTEAMLRLHQWKISIYILQVIFMQSQQQITCYLL